jgi:hypothetical protein
MDTFVLTATNAMGLHMSILLYKDATHARLLKILKTIIMLILKARKESNY